MKINRPEQIYQNITNRINSLIPVKWKCIYLYTEVHKKEVILEFFFQEVDDLNKFIHYDEIPKKYNVPKGDFAHKIILLYQLLTGLHDGYANYTTKKWSELKIKIEQIGDFEIEYGFIDCTKTLDERKKIWKESFITT